MSWDGPCIVEYASGFGLAAVDAQACIAPGAAAFGTGLAADCGSCFAELQTC